VKKNIFVVVIIILFVTTVFADSFFIENLNLLKFESKDFDEKTFEFVSPISVVFLEENYFVLDAGAGGILQFNSKFIFEKKLYGIGQGPCEIAMRTSFLLVWEDKLLIPDTFNGRIQVYNIKENNYKTVKTPEMTFVTNGVVVGEEVYFGGMNCLYKLSKDFKIKKIKLDLGNPTESILNLVSLKDGKLISTSMLLHGKKQNKIYMWEQNGDNFKFKPKVLPQIKEVDFWKKKNKFPILFVSVACVNKTIYISTKIQNDDKGSLLFKIDENGKVSQKWLKGINFAMFSFSKTENFIISAEDGKIYQFKAR